MMLGLNFVKYGFSSARTTPGVTVQVSLYWSLKIAAVITQDMVIDDNLK